MDGCSVRIQRRPRHLTAVLDRAMYYVMGSEPRLLTVGAIAERLGVPLHRVQYVLRTRDIQPAALAGIYRLYLTDALDRIREALAETAAKRP